VEASPGADAPELVSVSVFRLAKPYRPALWPKVVPEFDRVADELASALSGRVTQRKTTTIGGRRSRRYEIAYARDGADLLERTAFVVSGRREYQLLCRLRADDTETGDEGCSALFGSFRLTAPGP
jgi:hypothetical protein